MLRIAEKKDFTHVLRMARSFHSSSPYKGQDFCVTKCQELFESYLKSDKKDFIIILAEDDKKPFGMIIGISTELPFSRTKAATELAWWVDEDKRGKKDAFLLFKAFEDWSNRIGSDIIAMAMLDASTDLSSFYLKQGYVPAERTFFKEV